MLPQEVKNRIYHFVCGGQMVHIHQNNHDHHHHDVHGDDNVKLTHALCIEPISEEQLQKDFDSADPATGAWNIAGIGNRHVACHLPLFNKTPKGKKGPKVNQLSLTHLRVCRQLYFEADKVHYTNNTFAIVCNNILERFARARFRNKQHLGIRSLYLEVSIVHAINVDAWSNSIEKILRRFKSVRYIHLNLVQLYCSCNIERCRYESDMTERQASMFKKLGKLPLRKATLTVVDDSEMQSMFAFFRVELRWTMRQKQEFSREVRKALLG